MKRFATIAALLFAVAILIGFTGCKKDTKVTYTVSFDTDGGNEIVSQTVEDGEFATKPEDPAKTGYTFDGWYNGETAFDFATPITADISLKAKWTANTYKVTLVVKGDTTEDDESTEITVTYDQNIPDLEEVPEKTDLVFGGFFTEELAEGTKYIDDNGKGCNAWKFTEDKTLYAVFGNAISYTTGKNVANNNPVIYIAGKGVESLTPLECHGYDFLGWSKTNGGSAINADEPAVTTNATGVQRFYALWSQPIVYTITYNGLEDGDTHSNPATYTVESPAITLQNAARPGNTATCLGWKKDNADITEITQGSFGDIELTAVWEITKSDVIITSGIKYGEVSIDKTNPVAYGETVTVTIIPDGALKEFTVDNQDFTNSVSNNTYQFEMPAADVNISALFYFGSKKPDEELEPGDIVFSDHSSRPYVSGLVLDDEQKAASIAVIFYKGKECSDDDTTNRILGVGISSKSNICFCSNSANGFSSSPDALQSLKNGSNSYQIFQEALGDSDDTDNQYLYPAFYFINNYNNNPVSHVKDTDFADGWYLPTFTEVRKLYNWSYSSGSYGSSVSACGGNGLETNYWMTSTLSYKYVTAVVGNSSSVCDKDYVRFSVCAIREF